MNRYVEALEVFLVLFFIASIIKLNVFFAIWSIALLLFLSAIRLWRWYFLKNLNATIRLHMHRSFPGEEVRGELIVENYGELPIFGLHINIEFSKHFQIKSDFLLNSNKYVSGEMTNYSGVFNLNPRERRTIPFTLIGQKRGAYVFKYLKLWCKDPFGVGEIQKEIRCFEEILVYPQEMELQHISHTFRMPQGDVVVKRWIHDDLFFPVGARPYQYGDAFNRIDFKATAKMLSLHTKKYDYTAHGDVCVVANLLTTPYKWETDYEVFERILSIVARMSRECLQKDLRLSIIANAQMGGGLRVFEIPSSTGRKHYRKILEVLARFSSFHATPFSLALSQVRQRYSTGAPVIIISAMMDEVVVKEIHLLLKKGYEVFFINPSESVPKIVRWQNAIEEEMVLQHA